MYSVQYLDSVKDDIRGLPKSVKIKLKKAIEKKLTVKPIEFGKPLQYSLKGLRRLRVWDHRIIFKIDEGHKIVLVVKIGHRKEVYRP